MAENKREEQLKEITDRLEQGVQDLFTSERYTEYLQTMGKFHRYSFNNTLLIAMQRPDATLIAGYQAWQKKFNRHVMRGEKGIQIISPAPIKEKEEVEKIDPVTNEPVLKEDGQPETEIVEHIIPRFKVSTVFDVSQTDGEPLPDLGGEDLTGNVADFEIFMEAIRNVSPVPIRMAEIEGESHGYYHNDEKEIVIKSGMSESQTMKTAIHEVTHAMLHDREIMQEQGIEKDRLTKEVEAESVAYTVCQHFGLDSSDYSFPYIAGWSSGKEMRELRTSMDVIRKTAGSFIEEMTEQLQILQKEYIQEKTHLEEKDIILKITGSMGSEYSYDVVTNWDREQLEDVLQEYLEIPEAERIDVEAFLEERGADLVPWYDSNGYKVEYPVDFYDMEYDYDTGLTLASELSAMQQAELLIHRAEYGASRPFGNEERNLIINYAFKLDDMDKTRALIEKIHDGIETGEFHTVNTAMDEAQEEIDALPDGLVGLSEMHEFGYSSKVMLPLTKDRALELFQDGCEVFHLYPDDTEETVDAEEDFDTLDVFYGIETDTWERYRLQETERNDIGLQNTEEYQDVNFFDVPALFSNGRVNSNVIPEGIYRYELQGASYDPGYPLYVKEAVGVNHAGTVLTTVPVTVENTDSLRLGDGLDFSGGTQTLAEYQKIMAGRNRTSDLELVQSTMGRNNEAVYLNGAENRYAIYQIVESTKGSEYKFMNLDFVTSHDMAVDAADYAYTFGGYLTENDTLDSIYERFNLNHPEGYTGHSLSVSDVVVMQKDGQTKAYYVDSFGFSEVPGFVQQRLHEAQMIQKREDSIVTLDTTAVEIEQHEGQWHTADKMEIGGEIFYLMRHNEYGNSVAAVILNSDGELVAQDLENGFDHGAMEAIQEFLHDRGIEWNMEEEDREVTYWIAKEEKYLYFQTGSEGYDYTIYDSEYKEEDGGVLDDPEMRFEDALRDILENELNVTIEDCEEMDSEEFLEIVERAEYFPQKSYELLKEQMDKDIPEIAFQSGYGYAYIQRVENGFNTIVYDSDWKEISGSFYEASDVPMEKAVGWFFRDEELGTLECMLMNPEELKKNALQAAKKRLTEEELTPTSEVDIKEATLNGQSRNDIEVTVLSLAQSEIEEQGLENEVKLLGARVFGSRTRAGLYADTSDVDVVLSYTGNIREDAFFNSLNEYGLSVAGLKVDINPISLEQTGTLEEYMEKAEAYLDKRELEKLAEDIDQFSEDYDTYGYRDAVEGKKANIQMIYSNLLSGETEFIRNWLTEIAENRENDTDDMVKGAAELLKRVDEIPKNEMEKAEPEVIVPEEKEATITFYVAECMEFPVMGEYQDNLSLEEALKIYETIPEERMHGIKGIGFTLHDGSIYDDMEYELMAVDEIRDDMFDLVPYYKENPLVQKAVADVKAYLNAKKEKEAEISTISEGVEPEMTEQSKPEKEKEIPEKAGSKKESVLKALRERQAKIKAQEQEKPAEKSHSKKKGEQEL